MRTVWILLGLAMLVGCATSPTATIVSAPVEKPVASQTSPMHEVETRYEVRGYRDANDPNVRHEAHAVYRTTRVPASVDALEVEPRSTFASVSHAPLPPSAELAAELGAQKQITSDVRAIEARMTEVERQAQSQYATLMNQTAETIQLRQQLEKERARLRELESPAASETK
jgi:hypothetical protein